MRCKECQSSNVTSMETEEAWRGKVTVYRVTYCRDCGTEQSREKISEKDTGTRR